MNFRSELVHLYMIQPYQENIQGPFPCSQTQFAGPIIYGISISPHQELKHFGAVLLTGLPYGPALLSFKPYLHTRRSVLQRLARQKTGASQDA